MTRRWRIVGGAALAVALVVGATQVAPKAVGGRKQAAKVGDENISLQELEQSVGVQLAQLEQQRFALLSEKLTELISERLVAQEAAKRGINVERLLRAEVYAKSPEISEAEVTTFMSKNSDRLPSGDVTEVKRRVRDHLRSERVNQVWQAYVDSLRARNAVVTYLEEPRLARVAISSDKGFARGPNDAGVVVVEFADFQCPYCQSVVPTLRELLEKYPRQVRWVFRDFPISSLHPAAPIAHEAARCAGAQGKFWEYHDLLFERSPRHAPEELKQYARDLQIDSAEFERCLDGGTSRAEVMSDVREGGRLGVSATPTFFVNGRALVGSQPLSEFQKLIERELSESKASR